MLGKILVIYLVLVNALSFLFMHMDKQKAKRGAWRIPESTLLGISAAGGSIGAILGMYTFHHKTRHPKFSIGLPVILVFQISLAIFFLKQI